MALNFNNPFRSRRKPYRGINVVLKGEHPAHGEPVLMRQLAASDTLTLHVDCDSGARHRIEIATNPKTGASELRVLYQGTMSPEDAYLVAQPVVLFKPE